MLPTAGSARIGARRPWSVLASTAGLARRTSRNPWQTVIAWVVILALGGMFAYPPFRLKP